ncbi:hypothetical protein VTO42DRAFT_3546 [Malbranchea cinnamomea]
MTPTEQLNSSPETGYAGFYTIFSTSTLNPENHMHYRCILADSAATSHVLNAAQKDRLTNLQPANGEFLTHGDTRTMIEAFSDAYVKPNEGKYFVLRDIVYVPSFQSSLVSLQKAHLAGWSYKAERGEQLGLGLYKLNGVKAATAILNKGLYCLEYRPNPCSAFATTTQKTFVKPLSSSFTIELWRSRLGWPSEECIQKLPDASEGVIITNLNKTKPQEGEPKPLNISYELENLKHQISRRTSHQPAKYLFEHLWVDIIFKSSDSSRDLRFDKTKRYNPNDPHISEELHEEVSDIIETIHTPERSIHFENSMPLLEFDVEDLAKESLGKPTTKALTEASEQAIPSLKETSAPGTKDLPADIPDHLPTPEPTPEPMLETIDVAPTDPLDNSTPGHTDLSYNAPYDDVEGLNPSDFDPVAQLALDLDTFMNTNLPLEAENPTNPSSTVMPDSFNFNNPTPRTNITP